MAGPGCRAPGLAPVRNAQTHARGRRQFRPLGPHYLRRLQRRVRRTRPQRHFTRHRKRCDRYLFTFTDVAYAPGEIKAVATSAGKVVATQSKRTAGAPAALKLTALTAPGGLRADGADVALIDVEIVDAAGNRCPTAQQRADFETTGPAVWRRGYNSGKINSVNHPYLDLEAGLNRVAVRATRTAGSITVRTMSEGLTPASLTLESKAFAADNGLTPTAPVFPAFALPQSAPARSFDASFAAVKPAAPARTAALLGPLIKTFHPTGPGAAIVHVESGAQNGKKIYVDRDATFTDRPPSFAGADWVQIADDDQRDSAVDLIELAVTGGTVVSIAHDDRAPLPSWLTKQFKPSALTVTVNGVAMKLFQRTMTKDGSLTFGSHTEGTPVRANHYVVFVNAPRL